MTPQSNSPSILSNPYEWDGLLFERGIQPIYFSREPMVPGVGQEYELDNINRLFAKSYGNWEWQGSDLYCDISGLVCTMDNNQCPGGICERMCSGNIGGLVLGDGIQEDFDLIMSTSSCADVDFCKNSFRYSPSTLDYDVDDFNDNNLCVVAVGTGECSLTETPCTVDADCQVDVSCDYQVCIEGDYDGMACDSVQTCVNDNCVGENVDKGNYVLAVNQSWDTPSSTCPLVAGVPTRPTNSFADNAYCSISPIVDENNILINKSNTGINLKNGEIAHLVFTSRVDSNQEPLVGYSVYWDGSTDSRYDMTVVSGIEINSQPNPSNPHSVYHLYSYWDLKQKSLQAASSVICGDKCFTDGFCSEYDGPYCVVKPMVQVKDNWDWCNHGSTGTPCPQNIFSNYLDDVVIIMETVN